MAQNHTFTAFMDAIDFFYERGQPAEGNRVFADLPCLRHAASEHIESHGIVEVEVKLLRIVEMGLRLGER